MPKEPANPQRGHDAEVQAQRYLSAHGLRPLAHNYRTRYGEIDLIMQEQDALIFVEVRLRNRADFGAAAETVTPAKQRRIRAAAAQFLQEHPQHAQRACRFDVVAFDRERIQWLRDAFS